MQGLLQGRMSKLESGLEQAPWKVLRWVVGEGAGPDAASLPTGACLASDAASKPVILFPDQWSCDFYTQRNPEIELSALPIEGQATRAE